MGRTVQDFETYGIQNLRSFMRGCTLPNLDNCDPRDFTRLLEIDWYNKIYKNRLNVRSEPWRKLENIYKLPAFITGSVIPDWLNGLPSGTLRRVIIDAKERPEARSNLAGILPEFWAHKPCVFNNVIPWMDLALVTATKVLHHSHPSTRDWAFVLCEGDREDLAIFRHFVWCPPIYQQRGFRGTRVGLLVVAIQPHWVLTDKDLEKFVNCKSFPPFSMPGYAFPSVLEGPIRVWAKMWDTCVNAKAQYFVLSTYNQWVFGGFSEGYRTGFVSPIYKNDATSPTIIEYLSFWVATSMKLNNTYGLPKVGDEVPNPYESPSTAYDALLFGSDAVPEPIIPDQRIDIVPSSFSPPKNLQSTAWSGFAGDVESSAMVDMQSMFSGRSSLASHYDANQRSMRETANDIDKWRQRCTNPGNPRLREDVFLPVSPPPMPQGSLYGEWLM